MVSPLSRKRPPSVRSALGWIACLGSLAIAVLFWRYFVDRPCRQSLSQVTTATDTAIDDATESRIRAFCGDCHAVPRPESFHRDAWVDEVELGYIFHARSGRTDLDAPPLDVTANYFRSRAPERIEYPQPRNADAPLGTSFKVEKLSVRQSRIVPALASLRWVRIDRRGHPVLVVCDMRGGYVLAVDLHQRPRDIRPLARLRNPCHAEPCDLDADGDLDLVIADLGSFVATDHDRGKVVWLRSEKQEQFDDIVLASGLGRVDDVRAADFDSDGDLDLLVADFGWHRTGRILLLRNIASSGEMPRFKLEEIDSRPGTTTVPVWDINGDGRLDFLALVSQEYECVEAFFGQENGGFHCRTLWRAPDLTFGSSTISLADLDLDGDMDVLFANGDAFDNHYVPPWHGAQWLENRGRGEFKYHRLTDLSGACRIRLSDFDLDGDQDLVVAAFLPLEVKPETATPNKWPSVLLLEQTSPGRFARHVLETGFPYHAGLEVADFDGDGDTDFAVGTHGGPRDQTYWIAVWWNQKIRSSR